MGEMAARPKHRRAKTAGVGQLEAFDGLSLQVDAYDKFDNAAAPQGLDAHDEPRTFDAAAFLEPKTQDYALGQCGMSKRMSLGGEALTFQPAADDAVRQSTLAEQVAAAGQDQDLDEGDDDGDDELSELATMRSALVYLVDTEQRGIPERMSTGLGLRAESRPSVRFSVQFDQKVLPSAIEMADEALIARLRTLEEEQGNQFVSIIDAWRNLQVTESGDMIADQFITAMQSILIVVDALGGALSVIKNDWNSQMAKVKASCVKHGIVTLHRMVECENAKGEGTDCLIWMKRSLQFVEIMMTRFLDNTSLPDSVEVAYKRTLHDAHPWVVRLVAGKIRFAVPGDEVFLNRLYEPDHALVKQAISLFLRIMRPKLAALVNFFNVNNIERVKNCQALPEALNMSAAAVLVEA
ncbi:Pleckstrin homology domain-containing family A member 8 [Porphyridium purpureum]|uniref:Pleckstrin homology domain-containing family A member 8 n=1 Tax=Porphyridium purpureum TaxID=35688 RepID=A0A5J4YUD7_PORPP|nr:Pleckstrin homology domain-containing family A member 8 [Porphyridium purpureum]|eukprot:POR1542..scf229_5